jgi:hypothetical protein
VLEEEKLKKFGMIGMDACVMGNWEAAVSISNLAEMVIASEQNEPGHGWDWTAFNTLLKPTVSSSTGCSAITRFSSFVICFAEGAQPLAAGSAHACMHGGSVCCDL